jgi:hypothetical protein
MDPNKRVKTEPVVIKLGKGEPYIAPPIDYDAPLDIFDGEKISSLPLLTDEEVTALMLEAGCPPAGWEILSSRKRAEDIAKRAKERQQKDSMFRDNNGNLKNLSLKERAKIEALKKAEQRE